MLSDRPYRKALSLPAVKEQLRQYSGTQFDKEVVRAVVERNLLEDHAAELAHQDEEPQSPIVEETSPVAPIDQPEPRVAKSLSASS